VVAGTTIEGGTKGAPWPGPLAGVCRDLTVMRVAQAQAYQSSGDETVILRVWKAYFPALAMLRSNAIFNAIGRCSTISPW